MVSQSSLSMTKTTAPSPPAVPHLPNELKIRILSFIDDPEFLWINCRHVSRAFKQWSEEQYARDHLPKLRLEMHVTPSWHTEKEYQGTAYVLEQSEFLFYMGGVSGTAHAILKPRGPPFSTLNPIFSTRRILKVTADEDFALLDRISLCGIKCQVHPEIDLGLRPSSQNHVCSCRSLRVDTKRGFCDRYIGAGRYFEWNVEDRVLIIDWIKFLDYVHSQACRPAISR